MMPVKMVKIVLIAGIVRIVEMVGLVEIVWMAGVRIYYPSYR